MLLWTDHSLLIHAKCVSSIQRLLRVQCAINRNIVPHCTSQHLLLHGALCLYQVVLLPIEMDWRPIQITHHAVKLCFQSQGTAVS